MTQNQPDSPKSISNNSSPAVFKMPKFHIVVPSFNQGEFIGQTIDSLLSQSDAEVKIYVFDGCSTDETIKILKSYGKRIFWVSQKDEGQTDAINQGIKKILSSRDINLEQDFFAYLNSDDFYKPNILADVRDEFAKHPKQHWLVGGCTIINDQGKEIQKSIRLYKATWLKLMKLCPNLLFILNPITQPTTFVRLKAVKAVGEFNPSLRYTMDYEYWLRLSEKFGLPINLSKTVGGFRIHAQSKGSLSFKEQFEEQLAVAGRFTDNRLLLIAQKLHNNLITAVYKLLK